VTLPPMLRPLGAALPVDPVERDGELARFTVRGGGDTVLFGAKFLCNGNMYDGTWVGDSGGLILASAATNGFGGGMGGGTFVKDPKVFSLSGLITGDGRVSNESPVSYWGDGERMTESLGLP
jgi:hypothetical protein